MQDVNSGALGSASHAPQLSLEHCPTILHYTRYIWLTHICLDSTQKPLCVSPQCACTRLQTIINTPLPGVMHSWVTTWVSPSCYNYNWSHTGALYPICTWHSPLVYYITIFTVNRKGYLNPLQVTSVAI